MIGAPASVHFQTRNDYNGQPRSGPLLILLNTAAMSSPPSPASIAC